MQVRAAEESEIAALARIWYDSWQDAHSKLVPAELARVRTLQSFVDRISENLGKLRVVGPIGAPLGFCMIKNDELHQLYVAAEARGSGVAAALIADAEIRLSESGVETAWLGCAIGNERAARFYEKCGWKRTGEVVVELETIDGVFLLEVWRYEKDVRRRDSVPT